MTTKKKKMGRPVIGRALLPQVKVSQEIQDGLEEAAAEEGTTQAEIRRRAYRAYLQQWIKKHDA